MNAANPGRWRLRLQGRWRAGSGGRWTGGMVDASGWERVGGNVRAVENSSPGTLGVTLYGYTHTGTP